MPDLSARDKLQALQNVLPTKCLVISANPVAVTLNAGNYRCSLDQ